MKKATAAPVERTDRLTKMLLELGARKQGVHSAEVSGWSVTVVSNACNSMVRTGLFCRIKMSHKCVRFFTTQAVADAYLASHRRSGAGQAITSARSPARQGGNRAWWNPKDESIQPVFTKKTKHTGCKPMPQPTRTNTYPSF